MPLEVTVTCYFVSYDLPKNSDYAPLIKAIKSYGTWAHITESLWAVVTDTGATAVRDRLGEFVPSGGRLFVAKAASGAAWRNVICRNEWLKEHLP